MRILTVGLLLALGACTPTPSNPPANGLVTAPATAPPATAPPAAAPEAPPSETPTETSSEAAPLPVLAPDDHQGAFQRAKPVFDKYCASCHVKDGSKTQAKALPHFDMTTYPFGGHHANEVAKSVRKSIGASGSPATMPLGDPGIIKGAELELIVAWADAFDRSRAGKKPPHDSHSH